MAFNKRPLAVLVDTAIVFTLIAVPAVMMGMTLVWAGIDIEAISSRTPLYIMAGFSLLLGIIGFAVIGSRAPENFWYHLVRVAFWVWIIEGVLGLIAGDDMGLWLIRRPFALALLLWLGAMLWFGIKRIDQRLEAPTSP